MRSRAAYAALAATACIIASIAGATARWRDGDGFATPVAEAVVHYAPTENLEHIDVALIEHAKTSIDMAAYVLTDWAVIQALVRAADRGVAIRIYLDGAARCPRPKAALS
jgi:phosphatidylserine/phosphatidylglycerophosphate/cardiolipin synthase-like enzyme